MLILFPKMIQTNCNDEKGMQCTYIIICAAVIDTILDIPKKNIFIPEQSKSPMSFYCHLSPNSWQFPLGISVCTLTKTPTNYHLALHDCRNTSTSYWYLLLHVNIIVQAYISLKYCGNKHNIISNDKFIFTCIFSQMICLYGKKTFISYLSATNGQEIALIINNASILTRVYSHRES